MRTIIWECFEIAVNFYQSLMMIYFPFRYLGGKYSDKFTKNYGLLFVCFLTTLISIFNQITAFEHIYIIFYFILIFIYSCICLKNDIYHKIFSSVYPLLIVTLSSVTVSGVSSVVFNKSFSEILIENDWQRFIVMISAQLIIFYATYMSLNILQNYHSKTSQLSKTELLLITLTLFMTIVIEALFCFVSLENIGVNSRIIIAIGFICLIIINIVTLYIIIDLKNKNNSIIENEKLKIQLEYNKQYVENANIEYELIRKLRHDTKNVYCIIDDLLASGKIEKARSYIGKMTHIADERLIFVKTENTVVNSVINAKLTIAKSFGINVTCFSVDNFGNIDDIDLCRLLSNMIENAITATSNNKIVDKEIILKITEESQKYVFLIKNSIDKSVLENNPQLLTTRKSKDSHGYGVKIIRDIARNYNGRCDFFEEDDMFCCLVVLNP